MKYSLYTILTFLLLLTGCGEMSSIGERVNISIGVNPSTAGNVLSSGGDEQGATAEFLAVPNEGWQFVSWSGDIDSNDNPLTTELEDDISLVANFEVLTNHYRFDLDVTDGNSVVELAFGQIEGATDSYDSGMDLEAPPGSPPNSMYAWFENDDRKLFHDFRNASGNNVIWKLMIEQGENEVINLKWNLDDPDLQGSVVLSDADQTFEIDMMENQSTELNLSESTEYTITYSY